MTDIVKEQTIWCPGVYEGRTEPEYTKVLGQVSTVQLIEIVQRRAKEDGEWIIEHDLIEENRMRKMMAWVSDPDNIRKSAEIIYRAGSMEKRTVDYICRDLANASNWIFENDSSTG